MAIGERDKTNRDWLENVVGIPPSDEQYAAILDGLTQVQRDFIESALTSDAPMWSYLRKAIEDNERYNPTLQRSDDHQVTPLP